MSEEINIDLEVTLLRKTLLTVVNESKLPITVKAMIVSEFNQAVSSMAEAQVIALLHSERQKKDKDDESEAKEG